MRQGDGMKRGISIIFLIWAGMLQSYIYEIKVLRKWDAQAQRYHYVIGLSDFHDKAHDANQVQRNQLVTMLCALKPATHKILVEDLSSPNEFGKGRCNQFMLTSQKGILASLAQQCHKLGLDVDNIEYRYCRVICLGGLLTQINESPYRFEPARTVRIATLLEEVEHMLAQIKEFSDGKQLNAWYGQSCNDVGHALKKLKFHASHSLSCADYIQKASASVDRMGLLKHLLTFDSALVDCLLVHAIINAANKERIIAIAGGTHITRAFDQLTKLGYSKLYSSKTRFNKDYDLANCLGSNIQPGGFCMKPVPLDVSVLQDFLK